MPPGFGPLVVVFFVTSFVQKLANNYEGLTKVLVRGHLAAPPDASGLGLDAAAGGAFLTAAGLGYYIKPLLGAVTDRLPVFGYRRKSWLVISAAGTAAAWGWVAAGGGATAAGLLAALVAVNLTVTFADVVCDGLMVESGQAAEKAGAATPGAGNQPFQSAQWLGALSAMLLATVAGGLLARFATLRDAALMSAVLPLVAAAAVAFLVREERVRWDRTAARPGLRAAGLAVAVGVAVIELKRRAAGTWLAPWEPLASPLAVLGVVLLTARFPKRLVAPAALVVLWPALPFKADSQYFYQYCTADNRELLAALEADQAVMPAVRSLLGKLGLDAGRDLGAVFYGSVVLGVELVGGLFGLAVVSALGGKGRLTRLLAVCLAGWAGTLGLYAGLTAGMGGYPTYLLMCGGFGGFALWAGNLATLFYAAARVPAADQATTFALLMGLSNLGGMFGVETAGGFVYATFAAGGRPNHGLAAVLAASAAHLAVLAGLVRWLAATGRIDRPR